MEKDFFCTTCPTECHLFVSIDSSGNFISVRGNRCERGEAFARQEIICPVRVLTTTVLLKNGELLPVRSLHPFPLNLHQQAMGELRRLCLASPVVMGDIIFPDIAGSGVPMVASCDG